MRISDWSSDVCSSDLAAACMFAPGPYGRHIISNGDNIMARFALALAATLACSTSVWAQAAPDADAKKEDKWDVNAPPGLATRKVQLSVDEGSWMNVDVAPDGRTIAFDLLGDIYTMPIEGGTPTRIAEGLAFEHQPRFSPEDRKSTRLNSSH